MSRSYTTSSYEQTVALGRELAAEFHLGDVWLFYGDLGAGKTSLIKGLISELLHLPPEEVVSPTFVYLQVYDATIPVYHFDLYRLTAPQEFLSMGLEDFLPGNGIALVEWPDRITPLLPRKRGTIKITHQGDEKRSIEVEAP